MLTALIRHGVDRRGQWKGLWNEKRRLFTSGKKMIKCIPLLVMLMQGQHQRVTGRVYPWPVTTLKCFKLVSHIRDIMKVDKFDFEYYGFCKPLASDLY